jgi:hypothetical protein
MIELILQLWCEQTGQSWAHLATQLQDHSIMGAAV